VTPNTSLAKDVAGCRLDRQYVTAHFVIWYTTLGSCAIQGADEVTFRAALGDGLEHGFDTYVNGLHYQLPATSQPYQVYVVSLQVNGLNIPPVTIRASGIALPPGVIFIDHHYGPDLSALGAHEFFHAIQWSYQQACMSPLSSVLQLPRAWFNNEDVRWWMEATADWAQREAVTTDRSYIDPIRTYLQDLFPIPSGPWRHMDARPISSQPGDNFAYSPLFPYYLVERVGAGKDIIRTTWEQYRHKGNCGSLITVLQLWVLPPNRKMEQIFPDYADANYFLAYNNSTEFRARLGNDFRPASDQREDISNQNLTVIGPRPQYKGRLIQYLGTGYVEFSNKNLTPKNLGRVLKIKIDLSVFNPSTPPVVKIWTITQATPPRSSTTIIPPVRWVRKNPSNNSDEYVAEAIIPNFDNDQMQWVAMEIVNSMQWVTLGGRPQPGGANLQWTYRAEVVAPTPTLTNTPTRTPISTATPTTPSTATLTATH